MNRKQRRAEKKGTGKKRAGQPDALAQARVHAGAGRWQDALAWYQKAIALEPGLIAAHTGMGDAYRSLGQPSEAEASYRAALALAPDDPSLQVNVGVALLDRGLAGDAAVWFRKALGGRPDYPLALNNLGNALRAMGQRTQAMDCYSRALAIDPNLALAHLNLGNVYLDLGRVAEAHASYVRAATLRPDIPETHSNLGNALRQLGRLNDAVASYRQAIVLRPGYVSAHINLGNALRELNQLNQSEEICRRAIALQPGNAATHNNLGNTLRDLGRTDEAASACRQALALDPDYAEAFSNLLFMLNYSGNLPAAQLRAEAVRYGQLATRLAGPACQSWLGAPNPERLRVGLVSGDLRTHPVGYFLESVLERLASGGIDLFAYPSQAVLDDVATRLRRHCVGWQPLVGLTDEAACALIRNDGIHILIDLSGHTALNRLPLFARKPAPVQATWLGYFGTTGVEQIDYLLGDPYASPPEEDAHFTETVWRLPETRLCFTPPAINVAVAPLPAARNGYVTFGCFNNLTKINGRVAALWAQVLNAVPGSKLMLKTGQLDDPTLREQTLARFNALGVGTDRLVLHGKSSRADYLAAYGQIDIALDPFPYPGGTTTVEALWMGVPTITLAGDRFLGHQGESIATNAGLGRWIAKDEDAYVALAVAHAGDVTALAALRDALRTQVLRSPVFDAARFAGHFETALWQMWDRYSAMHRVNTPQ